MPASLPAVDGVELFAVSEPCFEIGGDYYDALHLPTGLFVAIGDVSGKSVPAALLMSILQATVRHLPTPPPPRPPPPLPLWLPAPPRPLRVLAATGTAAAAVARWRPRPAARQSAATRLPHP